MENWTVSTNESNNLWKTRLTNTASLVLSPLLALPGSDAQQADADALTELEREIPAIKHRKQ